MTENETFDEQFLQHLDEAQRGDFVTDLNKRVDIPAEVTPVQLLYLLLVLSGIRPACCVGSYRREQKQSTAEMFAADWMAYTSLDSLALFLSKFDIPYHCDIDITKDRHGGYCVAGNYYISYDESRRETLATALDGRSMGESLSPDQHRAIGRFLGYPDSAVDAWVTEQGLSTGRLFDMLADGEFRELVPGVWLFCDQFDLEPRTFATTLLPYAVPGTADCREQVAADLREYLSFGLKTMVESELQTFSDLLVAFKRHWEGAEEKTGRTGSP